MLLLGKKKQEYQWLAIIPTRAQDRMMKYSIEWSHGASEERLAEIMQQIKEAEAEDIRDINRRHRRAMKGKSRGRK